MRKRERGGMKKREGGLRKKGEGRGRIRGMKERGGWERKEIDREGEKQTDIQARQRQGKRGKEREQ